MQINTNNKVQGQAAKDQYPFHLTQLYENRENQFFKQITLTNCRQGNHIPESRKCQLSKSLDILESQWKNYKIKQDHLASKKALYNIVKQNQRSEFNTVKKQPIFRQKYQIQHKRAISNMNFDFNENNKNSIKKSNSRMTNKTNQNIHTNTNSEQKSAKKWDKLECYLSPSVKKNNNINSSYMKLMAQQIQRQKCETDRFRLSLQNKNKPSKSSININVLVKQFKELNNKDNDYNKLQQKDQDNHSKQNKIIQLQKPKLKITLNQKKIQGKKIKKYQSTNDYLEELSTQISQIQKQKQKQKQKEENKCKLKLSRKKILQKNNQIEIKQQSKPHQYWTKKCQIKATVQPYQNHIKQQLEKDSKKSSLKQKKFGAIQKCNSKTLKITHVTKVSQSKLNERKNNSVQQSTQKRQKKSSIISVIQSQAQFKVKIQNSQQKQMTKNSAAVEYMQIQDIIRMSYNNNISNNKNNNYFKSNGNYFSLTTRS